MEYIENKLKYKSVEIDANKVKVNSNAALILSPRSTNENSTSEQRKISSERSETNPTEYVAPISKKHHDLSKQGNGKSSEAPSSNSYLCLTTRLRGTHNISRLSSDSKKPSSYFLKLGEQKSDHKGIFIFRNIEIAQIMGAIQLGLVCDAGQLIEYPDLFDIRRDNKASKTTSFPMVGSSATPCHRFIDFKFATLSPIAFRYFRELYKIKQGDYLASVGKGTYKELKNTGNCGSLFYETDDESIVFKTTMLKETRFLQKIIQRYYLNLVAYPKTLLPKFFGIYSYRSVAGAVRVIAMNNLIPSSFQLHEKFDIKGSIYNRKANDTELLNEVPTYKDLDFLRLHPYGIYLNTRNYDDLMMILKRDCNMLESFNIMNYSLLLGIHHLEKISESSHSSFSRRSFHHLYKSEDTFFESKPLKTRAMTEMDKQLKKDVVRNSSTDSDISSTDSDRSFINLWQGGNRINASSAIPAQNRNGDRLLLFVGIIDVLQQYELTKKLEYLVKSIYSDKRAISVQRPNRYSARFMEFIKNKVFIRSGSHSPP